MSQLLRRLIGCCFFLVVYGAQGDLVLSDYSSSRPMKIMPIGDSITDDCMVNGAWRQYLQPLLESAGYSFTFVGRQASAPVSPSFTKVRHEGYCGAVIAFPGVYAVHGYSQTNAYLLKIVSDALSVTNNRPDLVLLLIGANDIGRGRDPFQVATNDMAQLIDLILTNAPRANLVLAKITSLQNANLPGFSYAAFATNVPVYNAALQFLVNQRRALGQAVFLADMFTAVDYNTMFQSDHVHPNSTGLKAIAAEWLTRIRSLTVSTNQWAATLVHGGDWWNYSDGGQDLGTNWAQPSFDVSSWKRGAARFGYGDSTVQTVTSFGSDSANKFVTTYFRHEVQIPWNVSVTNLNVRLARTGGAIVWLNGHELFRTNLPSGPIASTTLATNSLSGYQAQGFFPVNIPVPLLPTGTNIIGVETHLSSPTNSVLGFDFELIGTGYLRPRPSLSATVSGPDLILNWPAETAVGYFLYSTDKIGSNAAWIPSSPAYTTNDSQVLVTQSLTRASSFFRLQRSP